MTARMTQLVEGAAANATLANENFDAVEPACCYGYCAETSSLLTFGYYGGTAYINDTYVTIADGTVTLTASQTNYIEASNTTGAVSVNTTGFTDGYLRLYEVVCDGTGPTSITDKRFNYGMFAASVVALPEFMGALVKLSGDLTTQNYSAGGQVPFAAETYDTHGFHDTVTNNTRLTVPTGLGITRVRVWAMVKLNLVTTGSTYLFSILKNGSASIAVGQPQIYATDGLGTDPSAAVVSAPISVSDGDYFEVRLVCTDTSITIASSGTAFAIEVVEATRLDQHRSLFSTITSSAGALTINTSGYEYFKTTLTENVTSVTMSGVTSGVINRFELRVAQDATGGRTWANPASWKFPGGTAYTPSAAANAVDILRGRTYDNGTTWQVEFQKGYA